MQVGREEGDGGRRDAQLTLFGAGGGTGDAYYIAALEVFVGGDERVGVGGISTFFWLRNRDICAEERKGTDCCVAMICTFLPSPCKS